MTGKKVTRRKFVADTGKIGLGVMIVPRHVLGGVGFQAPSDTINFAVVGFGGMGSENALELAKTENLVAFADVDFAFSESKVAEKLKDDQKKDRPEGITLKQKFDKAARYSDFREMLDKQKDIDGVVIATPDHLHAVVAKAAMQHGKHVYVQKPLTYSVHEARVLRELALANPKIVTQMGNQGHSSDGARLDQRVDPGGHHRAGERSARLDESSRRSTGRRAFRVRRDLRRPRHRRVRSAIHSASAREPAARVGDGIVSGAAGIALGSLPRPGRGRRSVSPDLSSVQLARVDPISACGALGDMGAHLIDHPFWALGLTYPTSIEATSTQWGTMPIPPDPKAPAGSREARGYNKPVSYPVATAVHYQFPARGAQPPGQAQLVRRRACIRRVPTFCPTTSRSRAKGGVIFIGEKGILMHDTYGANPRLFPVSLTEDAALVPKTYAADPVESRDELGEGDQGRDEGQLAARVRGAADRDDAARHRGVADRAGQEDSLRRRKNAGHQRSRSESVSDARVSRRLGSLNHSSRGSHDACSCRACGDLLSAGVAGRRLRASREQRA